MKIFILTHPSGISAIVRDLGATLQALSVPDHDGKPANILVGWKTPEEWLNNDAYFGSTVGRYANRIETLLSKPRYLLLLIMATFAVIL